MTRPKSEGGAGFRPARISDHQPMCGSQYWTDWRRISYDRKGGLQLSPRSLIPYTVLRAIARYTQTPRTGHNGEAAGSMGEIGIGRNHFKFEQTRMMMAVSPITAP